MECRGYPEGLVRTGTFYIHPEYLNDQLRWLSMPHPLVNQLHLAVGGDERLHQLQLPASRMQDLTPLFARLRRQAAAPRDEFALLSTTSDVFDTVGRLAGAQPRPQDVACATYDRPRHEVSAAIDLMLHHLERPWRIDELAREVALSPSQLGRLFQRHLGVSPAAYLRQLRADRMAELLLSGSLGVRQASRAAGWTNPVVATRAFRSRYGFRRLLHESGACRTIG